MFGIITVKKKIQIKYTIRKNYLESSSVFVRVIFSIVFKEFRHHHNRSRRVVVYRIISSTRVYDKMGNNNNNTLRRVCVLTLRESGTVVHKCLFE